MFNILLDELPTEWNGYKIDTDFQTGIMISQCLTDKKLSMQEQFFTSINLLFVDEHPSFDECEEAITWFLSEYDHDNKVDGDNDSIQVMDFDVDQWRIYAAFLNQYGIDLNKTSMHWFVFMGLLRNLTDCALLNVMEVRGKRLTKNMSKEEREHWKNLKKAYQINKEESEAMSLEEQKALNEFLKYAGIGATQS